ncbi:hypothetical protein GDO86_013948 [Hymenochirus boettgeri]|uniref:Uncharacterized protein n=1 Tax=Hymenochirus boettgeri TaxID=247094 RepID=A0A8T2JVC3_9PIPI|nr:hypothetical protein GDO86_013948 [Hymenochirus boettgeri]
MNTKKDFYRWCRQDMPDINKEYPTPNVERRLPLAIRLHEKKVEKENCLKQLQAATENTNKAMEKIQLRCRELKAKEPDMEELQFRMKKATLEIKQNLKKAAKERELAAQRKEKLKALQEELDLLEKKKAEVKQELDQKHDKFNELLKRETESYKKFEDIADLMNHFHVIKEALDNFQEMEEKQKKLRRQFYQSLDEKATSLLNLRTIYRDLVTRLEHVTNQFYLKELHLTFAEDISISKTIRLGNRKRAILEIFQIISRHGLKTKETIPEDDPVKQLQMIQQNVRYLSDVWESIQNKTKVNLHSL